MSTDELTIEKTTLVRSFELDLADGWDGRTLDTLVAPYNVPALVADPPDFTPYREMFMPGAFQRQLQTPGRDKVLLNFEHEQGIRGVIGQSLRFEDGDDGLHASFGIHENADGDKALTLINNRTLTGLSLEFLPLSSRRVDGVVQRHRVQLDKVSLCRYPAYSEAQVLAVREEAVAVTAKLDIPARASDVDERLAALGFEPLQRAGTTSKPWDGSPSRFSDEQYARSTLFCRPGDGPVKERCSLPVLEPDGTLNVNALGAAAGALAGARTSLGNVTTAMKAAAARKLIRYYNAAGLEVPESLRQIASSA